MGKPTGFLEYTREMPLDRPAPERVADWEEFHYQLPVEKLQAQAARCMDCGLPYCHTGMLLGGMASGCPINNLVPEWNDLLYRGLWQQAVERLLRTNNFPEFTGRVCPAPCEGSCTLGQHAPAVTIKNNERAIIDRAYEEGWITPHPPKLRTGKKIAVVGSGPSGLACADQLNRVGHSVTVFERADRVGGLLMYGIPNMKLDKRIVQRRIDLMAAEGVQFVTNTEVGTDHPADQLRSEYDAVVLCGGATKPRDLPIEGRGLQGIHFAIEFLRGNTRRLLDLRDAETQRRGDAGSASFPLPAGEGQGEGGNTHHPLSAQGKHVVVIGGGDTGTDCVGTALRHGCESVVQLEILECPPSERPSGNPWPQWPKVGKTDYGQEEAIALYGKDPRRYCVMTKRFLGDESGRVSGVETVQIEWAKGENGRPYPREIPGTEQECPADLVLLCMGFLGPEDALLHGLGVERDERSNARTEQGRHTTNLPGVFAAGDMRRGQSLVVWAINEGRAAARECDEYLMGYTYLP